MLGAYGAGGARAVVDYDLLAKIIRELLAYRARGKVDAAARGEGHYDAHRFRRIVLRAGGKRVCGHQRGEEKFRD